ncbi:MAG: hypothetical protein NTZ24_07855 [Deltaproteobacteria bacterium]|nr:hypothetical protein [Deltaproteobacteria bacterium]
MMANKQDILRSGFIPSLICALSLLFISPAPFPRDATPSSLPEIRVRLVDGANLKRRIANATVVIGHSDGSVFSVGKTGENGEITFNYPPVNATITAALSYRDYADGHTLKQSVEVYYDVTVPALTIPMDTGRGPLAGTVTLQVGNVLPGVTICQVQYGGSRQDIPITGGRGSAVLDVYREDFQNDGKLLFMLWGMDADNNLLGYGTVPDQAFITGMTIQAAISRKDFGSYTFDLLHIPDTAKAYLRSIIYERKGIYHYSDRKSPSTIVANPIPASLNVQTIPDAGESYCHLVELYLDSGHDGSLKSLMQMKKIQPRPSNQHFDFLQTPAVPYNLKVTASGTARPSFSWEGRHSAADEMYLYFFTDDQKNSYGLHFPPSRSTVTFPQLPDKTDSYRPAKMTFLDLQLNVDNYDFIEGWRDYLSKIDQFVSGTFSLPLQYNRETTKTHP